MLVAFDLPGAGGPSASSSMSSGRLFLERDARQQARVRFTGSLILKPFRDGAQSKNQRTANTVLT